ncbi:MULTISPECIES: DUF5336 domain-containing protein [unclassified Crossiella]|uniref:DUF5336 domain-containing protein n=1 Tax=unclassified Crossiella TaxID=2620835 RepID=UPI001FFFB580|nr:MULTISPECIES: DUF5336 domain-containing protein [unclassified Crossiella]MCK2236985.1 DUF5336 domain-containing protein [Crossiella sp. S99.2]MCK2250653.1 DUF5336 domain-containing protein [Crossiella sp. S99.1]
MSVPFGVPPPQPQQQPGQPAAGPNFGLILALVAAGLGLVIFFCTFSDDVSRLGLPFGIALMLASAVLTGMTLLPKAPQFLWVAAMLAVVGMLDLLVNITNTVSVAGLYVVVLIAAVLQAGAVSAALLLDIGMIKFEPKPAAPANPYGGQPGGWNPPSGAMPQQQPPYGQQPQQYGQPQQQPGQFGQPQQYGQPQQPPPAGGGFGSPEATRQFQHPGTPPSGFGGPQQS